MVVHKKLNIYYVKQSVQFSLNYKAATTTYIRTNSASGAIVCYNGLEIAIVVNIELMATRDGHEDK